MDNNSVKTFMQSKDCEKSLEKNEQQVLVLPPNLLQELGINLGNIQTTSDYPIEKGNIEPTNSQSTEKSKLFFKLLGTAGEEDIGDDCEKTEQLIPPILSSNIISHQKQEHIIAKNATSTYSSNENNLNINLDQNEIKIDKGPVIQMQTSESNSNIIYQKKSNTCKKKMKDSEFNSLSSKSSKQNSNNVKKSKISIISQEVVKQGNAETLKKLKLRPVLKNTLIPLKIDTPIGKVSKSISNSDNVTSNTHENSISSEPECSSYKMLQTKDLYCFTNTEEKKMNTKKMNNYCDITASHGSAADINKKVKAREQTEITCGIAEVPNIAEEPNLETCSENKTADIDTNIKMITSTSNSVTEMSVDNTLTDVYQIEIREDDEICTERNNNILENLDESNISDSDKQSMDVSSHNIVKLSPNYANQTLPEKVNLSPHHLTIKSKLCIQGVEKPGGRISNDELQNEDLKTYKNKKTRNGFKNKTSHVLLVNELTATRSITDACIDINNIDVTNVTNLIYTSNTFGRLTFDDGESEYGSLYCLPKKALQSTSPTVEIGSKEETGKDGINEEGCSETDNTYSNNDANINDFSNMSSTELSMIENDIPEDLKDNQKSSLGETCVNIYDEFLNDDKKSNSSYTFPSEQNLLESSNGDELLEQINPNEKLDHVVTGPHRNKHRRISTVAESDEKSAKSVTKKRKRVFNQEEEGILLQSTEKNYRDAPHAKKFISCVKCAVCAKEIPEVDWDSHLYENHCYIAWKEGSSVIDLDNKGLIQKLSNTLKKVNSLYCTFCGHKGKELKKMLAHFKICITKIFTNVNISNFTEDDANIENDAVKCEICRENVLIVNRTEHMTTRHMDAKTHIEIVPAPNEDVIKTEPVDEVVKLLVVKCAVCKMEMNSLDWSDHLQKDHNYLAWKVGDRELDLHDGRKILTYLENILKDLGGLVCGKCGLVRHYPRSFMKHINTCKGNIVKAIENDSTDINRSNQSQEDEMSLSLSGSVECGVCSQEVAGTDWLDHIHKEHNYLAKIRGVPPLDLENEEVVRKHLQGIRSITGKLTCAKCGLKRKIIKNFMEHIKECDGTMNKTNALSNIESDLDKSKDVSLSETITLQYSGTVHCGVCDDEVEGHEWLQHIQKEHNYIAWVEGAQPLSFETEEETWQYLNNVTKKTGGLTCGKCGLNRKYGKAYMQHVKECDGSKATLVEQLNDSQMIESNINSTYLEDCTNGGGIVKCGVCGEEVGGERWLHHIQQEHDYIAWVEGRTPINVEDKELVNTYLKLLIRRFGALTCAKCGLPRKLAKSYLQHVSKCGETQEEAVSGIQNNVEEEENEFVHTEAVQCGVCLQQVEGNQWILHIRLKHDYLARIAGKPPLDVNDEDQVRKHLSALKKHVDQLICNNCGEGRKHVRAFLRHVQNCDGAEKSDNESEDIDHEEEPFIPSGKVVCGVCKQQVDGEEWIDHIHKEHGYMATVEGRPPLMLNDEDEIRTHLNTIRRYVRQLVCNKCGESHKFVKSYMRHVKNCDDSEVCTEEAGSRRDSVASVTMDEDKEFQVEFPGAVVCGVCHREVYGNQWVHHIRTEHNYIAHVKGKTPIDINSTKQMKGHLTAVSKHAGGLYCNKCGLMRMYVKSYLKHVQQCGNSHTPLTEDVNDSAVKKKSDESLSNDTSKDDDKTNDTMDSSQFLHWVCEGSAKCGVCHTEVSREDWIEHIQKQHNYLAWIDGQPPLDLEDQEQVHAHLYELSLLQNGLTCNSCDAKRKYVKSFLDHIKNCKAAISDISKGTLVECAVCSDKMPGEKWKDHAMKKHYNIAWTVGSDPIDLKNPYDVEKYLKEYKKIEKSLICKICKLTRVSCAGFYAHIITCGKTEEEIEGFKSVCDICNSKYLCIYKNQHYAYHREQEYVKEKKSRALEQAQTKSEESCGTPGRRRAAQKAKNVIEDYKSSLNKFKHKCTTCNFGTDVEEELEAHRCEGFALSDSDASASVQLDAHSDDTDTDSDVDSNLSMEEDEQATDKKKRVETPAKVSHHIPFKINSASSYVSQAALDFYEIHYTSDVLFPDWKPREYQEVDTKDLPKYLPTVEESCKVKIGNEDWTTYKRFEAKKDTVISIFVGGSIRCVSWAAAVGGAGAGAGAGSYLAVGSHGSPDAPRLPADRLHQHPALIQLWDFADFHSVPKFVLGVALDYGTVWAMEWCPSGTRDPPHTAELPAEARLGLLAVACSNGSAYILPIPHPSSAEKPQIIKIKPSVELRLCSGGDRRKYQATAISWSKQKGHTIILVGYADGSTAFYDLNCDSPLLRSVENNITILYPFQDDRPHNTCITDVGIFASGAGSGGGGAWGAWGGASCTGVHAALSAGPPRLHAPLATANALFTPHWPSLLVTADEAIANYMTNELEWHGGGRRLGGQRALATCERCGAAAALTPPALRLMRAHPAYRDPRRDVVGMIRMAPLGKKRSKHTNDELSMKVEPLTYEDAVNEYGIELKLKNHMTKADQQVVVSEAKAQFPERFPLAEVPALAFCPAPTAHTRLALPTHAGLLFILNITYHTHKL